MKPAVPGPRAAAAIALVLSGWASLVAVRTIASAALPPPAGNLALRTDLNSASAAELEWLPEIGPTLAARIVERRESVGGFSRVEDLDRVAGIGPATIAAVAPYVVIKPPRPEPIDDQP